MGCSSRRVLKAGGTLPLLPGGTGARREGRPRSRCEQGGKQHHVNAYDGHRHSASRPTSVGGGRRHLVRRSSTRGSPSCPRAGRASSKRSTRKRLELERDRRQAHRRRRLAHTRPPPAWRSRTRACSTSRRGKWLEDQTVVVVGDTIKSVGPAKTAKVPAGAEIRRPRRQGAHPRSLGHALAPRSDAPARSTSASGVTTARDVGNDPDRPRRLQAALRRRQRGIGPHVLPRGLHRGARREGGVEQDHRGDRGRGEGRRRVLREARLRDDQDLQLGEDRARAHHHEARRTRAA